MAEPTNIIQAADVTAQAAIAAEKMADMLTALEENFNPESDIFFVPPIEDQLGDIDDILGTFGSPAPFDAVQDSLSSIASAYSLASVNAGAVPLSPEISLNAVVDLPAAPALTATMPLVNIPSPPTITIPSAPVAPVLGDVEIPLAPVVAIPAIPELAEVTLPSISSITIPLFTETYPEVPADLLPPDETFFYEEEEYSSDELVALRNILLDDLNNGGWGVNHVDEEALFDREVDRATRAGVNNEEVTIETMASRGFVLPSGPLAALLRRNQQATLNEISTANREVSVQRADLIRKSRENSISSSLTLNQTMVTHFGFVQQRLLSAAQASVDFALRAFNAEVEMYNTRLRAYQAYADVWNAQIQGQIAQLQAERAQLEAEALKLDVSRTQIDAYNAQVRAVSLQIDIYNTEMQAAQVRSEIERNRLLVFNAQVDAHRSGIQVEIAKIQAFEAQVNAEGTRVELYKTQVGAHESEVRAAKMVSDTQVQKAGLELEEQRAKLVAYDAEIKGYTAQLSAQEASANVAIASADGAGRTASAQADLVVGQSGLGIESTKYINSYNQTLGELRVMQQRNYSNHDIELMKSRIENITKPAEQWQEFYKSLGILASAVDVEIT